MLTPWSLLVTEPILTLFTLYLSIIYSVLFGLLPGFTYIFGKDGYYDFSQIGVGLCFLAIDVGFLAALPIVAWVYPRYIRKLKAGNGKVVPEERLWYAMVSWTDSVWFVCLLTRVDWWTSSAHQYLLAGMDASHECVVLVSTCGECGVRSGQPDHLHLHLSVHHRCLREGLRKRVGGDDDQSVCRWRYVVHLYSHANLC